MADLELVGGVDGWPRVGVAVEGEGGDGGVDGDVADLIPQRGTRQLPARRVLAADDRQRLRHHRHRLHHEVRPVQASDPEVETDGVTPF